jgi:large subunit ribosomal protein L5
MNNNPMHEIRIEKVTLNIGCGDDPPKIEKAKKLLEILTERKPVITKSKKRSTFGIVQGKPLGVMVTLRKKPAQEFFEKVLQAVDKKIKSSQFDKDGNLNVGIKEYIDLPGVKYSHAVGMLGLDVAIAFGHLGYRIKRRKIQKRNIPKSHRINKEEVANWLKEKFGVKVE